MFTVSLSASYSSPISVNYATANGTALGLDFTSQSGTLTFSAGQTSKTISIATKPDAMVEGNETFYLNLSSATGGATISDNQGIGTIIDSGFSGGGGEMCGNYFC
ncbi:hypothetical protein IDJ81_13580 [Tsuneonella flava]|uniref:Calx-beta domain-containing protein n=1 Tax=Tsuneonella flava TaxID=2055955 RepID=A0ABX7K7V8_9SPHN|nr:Calx-beta domain-containing protein [Tsuneonella flava]QSB44331.1 hypothetical protein IDJ81_13580 [Tsuneonella flava]